MNDFNSQCVETGSAPPDPRKHVNYVQGMVLGTDDLQQEFAYHQNQNQWLARDTIGYGTLSGLLVEVNGNQISVSPGTALSPRGHLIRVAPRQCAALDAWLRLPDTQKALASRNIQPGGQFNAHVILCFRDCPTDPLPVPGEPCRCDSSATANSRITDDFRLELRFDPPAQREEDGVCDFVDWIRRVRTTADESGASSISDFINALRTAFSGLASPLESSPDFVSGSPPENLLLPCCRLGEYLRAALKLWVTELRPLWQAVWAARIGGGCGCHGAEQTAGTDSEECLLLATLTVGLGQTATTIGSIQVDDGRRPWVTHLRMLQELVLCAHFNPCCNTHSFATLFVNDSESLRIWIHHPSIVQLDATGVSLEIDGQAISGFIVKRVETDQEGDTAFDHNIFDLFIQEQPEVNDYPRQFLDGVTIVTRFDLGLITNSDSPARTLSDEIRDGCLCYTDMSGSVVTVFHVALQSANNLYLDGDVIGSVHQNTVWRIQNLPIFLSEFENPGTLALGLKGDRSGWGAIPIPQPSTLIPSPLGTATVGSSSLYALADHVHPMPNLPPPVVGTTGLVRFTGVLAGREAQSGAIPHQIPGVVFPQNPGDLTVCIRLSLVQQPPEYPMDQTVVYSENLNVLQSFGDGAFNAPSMMVIYFPQTDPGSFSIVIVDTRSPNDEFATDWFVRWHAIPVQVVPDNQMVVVPPPNPGFGTITNPRPVASPTLTSAILEAVGNSPRGTTVAALAKGLKQDVAAVTEAVRSLVAAGKLHQNARGTITRV